MLAVHANVCSVTDFSDCEKKKSVGDVWTDSKSNKILKVIIQKQHISPHTSLSFILKHHMFCRVKTQFSFKELSL